MEVSYLAQHLTWTVSILVAIGALLHYANGVRKGTITSSFVEYWISDYPGTSVATVLVLAGLVATALTTGVFESMKDPALVIGALMLGYTGDSVVNKGAK